MGRYPHGRVFFAAHGLAAGTLGVVAVLLVAGHHHSAYAVGLFWLAGGAYLLAGGVVPRLRFGPVSVQRWRAAHARVERGTPRFGDRAVVAFDPYGRALNILLGGSALVYGVLRLAGRS